MMHVRKFDVRDDHRQMQFDLADAIGNKILSISLNNYASKKTIQRNIKQSGETETERPSFQNSRYLRFAQSLRRRHLSSVVERFHALDKASYAFRRHVRLQRPVSNPEMASIH